MSMNTIKSEDIKKILSETFPNAVLSKKIDDLKIGDFNEWDSLGNFNLLLAFEEFYNIRFSMEQVAGINSIRQIVATIEKEINE